MSNRIPQMPQPPVKPQLDEEIHSIMVSELHHDHLQDPKVLKFISSFLSCRDVRQASEEAGLHPKTGAALRGRSDIANCITKITARAAVKYNIEPEDIVQRVKEVIDIDPMDIFDDNNGIKPMREIAPEVRRAIKKIKVKEVYETDPNGMRVLVGYIKDIEFNDKLRGVELLGREKETFTKTIRQEKHISKEMADVLLEAERRADARIEERINKNTIDVTPKKDG